MIHQVLPRSLKLQTGTQNSQVDFYAVLHYYIDMAQPGENTITKAAMEEYVSRILESRLQKAMEEFVEKNDIRLKELSIIERVVRVEEELKALRETSELKFDSMNARFDALQREMNARFEAMNSRFSTTQWMIGLFVGIPALTIALFKVLEVFQ